MEKISILNSVKKLREISPKRKFAQTIDLIVNLKDIDIKKPEEKVDLFVNLRFSKGKKVKVCAFVDQSLKKVATEAFDKVILKEDFAKVANDKKAVKKLAIEYDYFVAQANLMTNIAASFGKVLGVKGKMPNPKAGCIVPPTAPDLKPVKEKLEKTIRLITKNEKIVKAAVGNEAMKDEEIVDNVLTLYNALIHILPQEQNNVKSVYMKLTMGPVLQVTDKGPVLVVRKEEKKKKKEPKETPKKEKKEEKPKEEEK